MGINDLKIQAYSKPVSALSNNPTQDGITAQELKERFDANANNEIKASINGIIEFLEALTGNEEIKGFKEIDGKFTYTLDGETYIETGYTKAEVDNLLTSKANEADVLTRTNAEIFTPTADYQPATKKYVDDKIASTGAADMTQAVYDPTGRQTDIFAEIDKKLSLAGGTLTGNLVLSDAENSSPVVLLGGSVDGESAYLMYSKDSKTASMVASTSGKYTAFNFNPLLDLPLRLTLADSSGSWYPIYGGHNKDLIAESFLSLAGGTLTGDIAIDKVSAPRLRLKSGSGEVSIYKNADATKNYGVTIADNNTAGAVAQLNMNAANAANTALRLTLTPAGGTAKSYSIFGEHNKPTGTYTGTGSAKTVSVGGIGNMLLLYGNGMLALVTPMGAICKMYESNAIFGLAASELGFSGGKLTISGSANTNFNASGVTYDYKVL